VPGPVRARLTALLLAVLLAAVGGAYVVADPSPTRPGHDAATTPTVAARACVRTDAVVDIGLSSTRYPRVLAHARRAIAAGWPAILVVRREDADHRRDRLLSGRPTRPGMDRDEYPPAMARADWRADVAYVPSGENRGAGSVMGIKLRRYCDGTRFRYVGY
jgi:hypothetical protein